MKKKKEHFIKRQFLVSLSVLKNSNPIYHLYYSKSKNKR
jgi:hypothetical protein